MRKSMTERQMEVLRFIEEFIKIKGFSPSYMDIANGLKLRSKSNIHRLVHTLKHRGFLKIQPYTVRSLKPIDNSIKEITKL